MTERSAAPRRSPARSGRCAPAPSAARRSPCRRRSPPSHRRGRPQRAGRAARRSIRRWFPRVGQAQAPSLAASRRPEYRRAGLDQPHQHEAGDRGDADGDAGLLRTKSRVSSIRSSTVLVANLVGEAGHRTLGAMGIIAIIVAEPPSMPGGLADHLADIVEQAVAFALPSSAKLRARSAPGSSGWRPARGPGRPACPWRDERAGAVGLSLGGSAAHDMIGAFGQAGLRGAMTISTSLRRSNSSSPTPVARLPFPGGRGKLHELRRADICPATSSISHNEAATK